MTDLLIELDDVEPQDSDYDGAWKEALRKYLQVFIEKYFPKLAELIDWTYEPKWLDKEISQIIGQAGHRNREVDVLFKVRLKDGREQRIYCHLEIQTSYESEFETRVQLYNAGLTWLFRQDVLTLAILADLRPNWRPCERMFQLAEFESRIRFPICKILDRLETDWATDVSLPVQIARAQIAALRTASDPEGRLYAKTQLVRNLYDAGYTADDIRELYRLIDWMMHLRPDLARRFALEHAAFEKERQMPYVTSIERFALARGREEGREEGREVSVRMLLLLLTRLYHSLPDDLERRVRQLTLDQSQCLAEALGGLQTLDELRAWLKTKSD